MQSSTMALMCKHGEIPMPDAAIFADTQWEPRAVYTWLDWLERELPFPVHRVTAGSVREGIVNPRTTGRFASVPWFIKSPGGSVGIGRRQCTSEYKIIPIRRKARALMIEAGEKTIVQMIGISLDEFQRMKGSQRKYITNVWPLIDKRMTRLDCLAWMRGHGYPEPPKSACIGCPFRSDEGWRKMKAEDPESFADAVEIDGIIREPVRKMVGRQYIHRSCKPLGDVDLSTEEERGQLNLFNNECEGMCGV